MIFFANIDVMYKTFLFSFFSRPLRSFERFFFFTFLLAGIRTRVSRKVIIFFWNFSTFFTRIGHISSTARKSSGHRRRKHRCPFMVSTRKLVYNSLHYSLLSAFHFSFAHVHESLGLLLTVRCTPIAFFYDTYSFHKSF